MLLPSLSVIQRIEADYRALRKAFNIEKSHTLDFTYASLANTLAVVPEHEVILGCSIA